MFAIKNLSSNDLDTIRANLIRKEIGKNELIIKSGEKGKSMFFLESGGLKVVERQANDGLDDQIVGAIRPGHFCGEEVILSDGAFYKNTVVALETSIVMELTKENLQKIMTESISTATKLLLGISKNYREALTLPKKLGKIVSLVSPKDGSGRTTIAVNLALELAKNNKKILLFDADFQLGNACLHLGIPANPNIARLVQMEERLAYERISKFLIRKRNISILASSELPQEAEIVTRSHVNQITQECAKNYDFVIIDLKCHIDDTTILLWDLSDLLLFILESNLPGLTRMKRLMSAVGRLNYPREKFLGVINRFEDDQADYLEEYRKILDSDWFQIRSDPKRIESAAFKGVPVEEIDPESPMLQDIRSLANRLLGKEEVRVEKGGVFKWMKSFFNQKND